jgi:hypothetical protein
LANRDAIEDALRKELRETKKALEEAKVGLENAEQELKKKLSNEQESSNQMQKSALETAQIRIESLNREVSALKSAADHTSLISKNKQLTDAVVELDKAFAKSEKKVGFVRRGSCFILSFVL